MSSDHETGCLLRSLASTKPSANILELGTGTGISAAWMLDGMDSSSKITSVDNDESVVNIARQVLGNDKRAQFYVKDEKIFLESLRGKQFDVIFADTWAGKVTDLDFTLSLLSEGGIYVVDDMLHQPHWENLDWDHIGDIKRVIENLEGNDELMLTKLVWSTGIIIVTKRSNK